MTIPELTPSQEIEVALMSKGPIHWLPPNTAGGSLGTYMCGLPRPVRGHGAWDWLSPSGSPYGHGHRIASPDQCCPACLYVYRCTHPPADWL